MSNNKNYRVFLVGGEKVKIVKSFTHTYIVQFVSGLEQEVHKSYVKSYYPNKVKRKNKKPKTKPQQKKPKGPSQTSLDL